MKKLSVYIGTLALVVFGTVLFASTPSLALDPLADACNNGGSSEICDNKDENADALIGTIVNTLLFIVGTLSVIMIIVGGIMYATSTGDSGRITKAKNTIMYSVVGLVLAFVAYAIVNWVVDIF